jgi:hypothetical protein
VVSIGTHAVEATAYNIATGQQLAHWSPFNVSVGLNGGSDLMYCH